MCASASLSYRPDIEGLRALAILLVVGAHAKVPGLDGGFVGVDAFFVLSGYLITGLLLKERQTSGRLNLGVFYVRRLRRLLPALMLMLVICFATAAWVLPPIDQPAQFVAGASAALWLSNFHFALSRVDYFANDAESNLFLHTWSLGVEEQFYLLWPLLVATVLGFGPKAANVRWLGGTLTIVFALSLGLCLWWTSNAPQLAFYMMPSRAWQFALGGGTFLLGDHIVRLGSWHPRLASLLGWAGAGLLLGGAAGLDKHNPYPGAWALIPSVGTACILAAGQARPCVGLARLLCITPMQRLGQWSYAWYLWHWPVLLFGSAVLAGTGLVQNLWLALLALLIAAISHRFVEAPIRRSSSLLRKPLTSGLSALLLILIVGSLAWHWHDVSVTRASSPEQLRYREVRSDLPSIYSDKCDPPYHSADLTPCATGSPHAQRTVVVWGDSIGMQWYPAYAQIFQPSDWQLVALTKSACPIVDQPIFYSRIRREFTECAVWRDKAIEYIVKLRPEVVIMGSSFTYEYNEDQCTTGTRRILERIGASTGQIYIMRSTPTRPFDGPACLAGVSRLSGPGTCVSPAQNKQSDSVFAWLREAAKAHPNVRLVDLTSAVCPRGLCRAELDGQLPFRDEQHLSARFAAFLAPVLADRLRD